MGEAWVRFAMRALYPPSPRLPGIESMELKRYVHTLRQESSGLLWLGVVAGAVIFQLSPLFTVLRPVPACLLRSATLDRHAQAISTTRIYLVRQAVFLLKMMAGCHWGSHPTIREAIALPAYGEDPGSWQA